MDLVAAAVADPVRRSILTLLRSGPVPAGEIAAHFPISRPAISRHLRVLRESGLVRDTLTGRKRLYELDPAPIAPLVEWLTELGRPDGWEHRFDALETEVYRTRRFKREERSA
ncbi:metalloregulator ArsR/SmtB family transcription factor [Dactylosporangium sp. AC04546]|uniref:ArsR/SmtB family transcription factor n=1 Tax=Dactylosporangium sp. AC04546 TaxID=2862460 RepID=UPI001EDCAA0B|nr:metalloregulator ArsR/SmtB family transcription factor [Dactylosporangium sp. AC04546]WVK84307.1 metalloregulator ArsR/SmtB family transcription factor [Dactylosporangium sp. AC04546]